MVGIVKWLRQRVVAPLCVGSNPTIHPINIDFPKKVARWGIAKR